MTVQRVGASRAARRLVRPAAGCAAAAALTLLFLPAAASAQHHTASPGLPHGIPTFCSDATIVSAGSGAWSDPNTWSPAGVPATGAKVRIAAGHEVAFDLVSTDTISCVVVAGALKFRTDTNTMLTVGTMLVLDGGELEIGSELTPVEAHVRAELVLANQAIDTIADPEQFGTGLLAFGTVRMHGAVKSPTFVRLAFDRRRGTGDPRAGDTVLTLDEEQIGWQAGDQLILPDTRQLGADERFQHASFHQAERLTAQAVDTGSVTLADALQFNHEGARDAMGRLDRTPHVGNLTRNVVIRSADAQGVRGHTLYTQQADVDIRYVQFQDMGRTLNEQPIDSTTFDETGNVAHIGANQIGRHAINLHHLRGPANPGGKLRTYQFTLVGNAFVDSRKAPITVRQSHYGLIQDNVIFNATGAGIMTADGNESANEFIHNFVVGIVGRGNPNDPARLPDDDGSDGAAFWFKGFNHAVWDNVAANVINRDPFIANGAGFSFAWPQPLHGAGELKIPIVKGADLSDPSQYVSSNMLHVPLLAVDNNEAYGAITTGLTLRYLGTDGHNTDGPVQDSSITNFTAWHIHEEAFFGYPTNKVTFDGFTVRGHRSGLGPNSTAAGFAFGDYKNRDVTIRGADIQGMNTGINLSQATEGTFLIENSRLQNYYSNISAMTLETAGTMVPVAPDGRTTIVRSVDFAPMPPLGDDADRPFVAVSMQWSNAPRNPDGSFYWDQTPDTLVINDYTVDGQPTGENYQLFYPPQETRNIAGGLAPCSDRPKDEFEGIVHVNGLPEFMGRTIACSVAGGENASPVAVDDFVTTDAGVDVVVDVLANDSDPDHDSLSLTNVSDPPHGSAQINGSTITYTPDAGFAGDDSFTYTIEDGRGGSVDGGVSVTVSAGEVNNPPTAVDDTLNISEDSGSHFVAVLANDTVAPDQGESLAVVTFGTPQHGTVSIGGESGGLLYTPNADFCGQDSFDYTITDGSLTDVGTVTVNVACVNDLPRPQPDVFEVAEDSNGNVLDVLKNDVDVEGNHFFVLGCFPTAVDSVHGTVTVAPNGPHVVYTPAPNFFGTASFVCKVTEGFGPGADQPGALVTVNVTPVNDSPTAVDDTLTLNEDGAATILPLANDLSAPDHAEILQVVATGPAQHGVVLVSPEGRQVTYRPNANFCGADAFDYTISDGNSGTDIGTVTISVTCLDDAPQPQDDVLTMPEDSVDAVLDVLTNDINVDGANDPLRVDACSVGQGDSPRGSFRVAADGSHVIYTPEANFFGTASFTCIIGDTHHGGANAPTARVTVNVTPVNDPPTAVDDVIAIDEDSGPRFVAVLANDTVAPDQGESLAVVSFGAAQHGIVGVGGESGGILYTPNADFCGQDSFEYTISDGSSTDVGRVTVNVACVNDLPRPQPDAFDVAEDSTGNVLDVLENDVDVEGNHFFVLGCFPTAVDSVHGTVAVAPNGTHVVYTPAPNFFGTASFVCRVTEGFGPGADQPGALVTVTVMPVNDLPLAASDSYMLDRDTDAVLSVSAPGILGNDGDADNPTLTAVQITGPANGSLTLNADGSFSYTPNAGFLGSDSFTYRASDGAASSEVTTVSIAVNAESVSAAGGAGGTTSTDDEADGATPADPIETSVTLPQGVAGSVSIAEGAITQVEPEDFTFLGQQVNITAPAATADAPLVLVFRLDASIIPAGHNHTTLQVFRNGDEVENCAAEAGMSASPDPCIAARELLADGDVQLAVRTSAASHWNFGAPDNTAPEAVNDTFEGDEDTALTGNVLDNDNDVDNDTLTAALVGAPPAGLTFNADGSFAYTPAADFNGTVTFTYRASDGTLESNVATATLTVRPVNEKPVAVDDTVDIAEDSGPRVVPVLANDTAAPDQGESLAILSFGAPAHGTVGMGGESAQLLYTPNADFCGQDSFEYTITDGSLTDVGTVTVNVACVNDLPRPQRDTFSVVEDSVGNELDVLANDVDIDVPPNDFWVLGCFGPVENRHGTVTLTDTKRRVIYTPDPNFFGTATFTCRVTEGFGPGIDQPEALVTVTVTPVNDKPVAVDDSYTTNEDTPLTVPAPGVLGNDTDSDSSTLQAALVGPAIAGLTFNADGSFTYTPAAGFHGTVTFTYRASDGELESDPATVTLTVRAVNDKPLAVDDSYTTNEDTPLTVPAPGVLGNDTDSDSSTLQAALVGPAIAGLTFNADGSFTYTPAADVNGTVTFTYRASDGELASNPATVTLTVRAVNDKPLAVDDSYTTNEGTPLTVPAPGVLGNDTDVDSTTLTAALVGPAIAGLTFNADGSFTYTPAAGTTGPVTFSYRASDGTLQSNIATVTITVRPADPNRQPWLDDLADDWWYEGDAIWMGVGAGDRDGDQLTFSAQGLPPGIQVDPHRGTISGQFERITSVGRHTITITVSDGSLSASETVTWEIREKNRAPWMPRPRDQKNYEHDTVFFQLAGADPDWDPITFTATGLPPGVQIDSDGTVHGHLPLGSAGTYVVTAKISDGRKSASMAFKWTVSVQQ